MSIIPRVRKLEKEKHELKINLQQIANEFQAGKITREEYLDKKYELLGGDFEDKAFEQLNNQIETAKKAYRNGAVVTLIILAFAALQMLPGGITGFATLGTQELNAVPVNQAYDSNGTLNMSFIKATSVRVSGSIYGQGETWIYLVDNGTRKLVHYADTRGGDSSITGMVTAGTAGSKTNVTNRTSNISTSESEANATVPVATNRSNSTNETMNSSVSNFTGSGTANGANSTGNETVNSTVNASSGNFTEGMNSTAGNQTGNYTGNITINNTESNSTGNFTGNSKTNSTTNSTNSNSTSNSTNAKEGGAGQEVFKLETAKSIYELGETVNVTILPEGSTHTLYMHTPSTTEILSGTEWTVTEQGEHKASALITYKNKTERKTKTFNVLTKQPTSTFTQSCVETCNMKETGIELKVVVDGTRVMLNNVTYSEIQVNETNATTNETVGENNQTANQTVQERENSDTEQGSKQKSLSDKAKCLNPNVNLRPESCFTQEELDEKFSGKNFTLVNSLGQKSAVFDAKGNMYIKGSVVENADGEPTKYDFSTGKIWIDALDNNLYLKGEVHENQETMMWNSRNDYVITNQKGMYTGIFEAKTGDLYLRGEIKEGGST